jgi:hypothetical protein
MSYVFAICFVLLLTRYHGSYEPGHHGYFLYFDIAGRQLSAPTVLAVAFVALMVVPAAIALWFASYRPFLVLERSSSIAGNSISLLFAVTFIGYLTFASALRVWAGEF